MAHTYPDVEGVVTALSDELRTGRPLVPFIGAGVSVGAGLPLISSLCAYLAKVKFYIEQGIYCHAIKDVAAHLGDYAYRRSTARYLKDFGWPDYNELDSELWHFIHTQHDGGWIDRPYERYLMRHFAKDKAVFVSEYRTLRRRRKHKWAHGAWALRTIVQFEYLQLRTDKDKNSANLERQKQVWRLSDAGMDVDWTALLMQLTEGNLDFIDSLFSTILHGHRPAATHIFLSHLSRLYGCKLLWTINFDDLLESSLRAEGLSPAVFDVSRDAILPHASLVNRQLSVVKAHGSSYGLRTGERLEYALDPDNRARVLAMLPDDSLILVLGCSGRERRMMDLIESAVIGTARDKAAGRGSMVFWIHHGLAAAEPVSDLHERLKTVGRGDSLVHCGINDIAAFLLQLCVREAGSLPPSRQPYGSVSLRLSSVTNEPLDHRASGDDTVNMFVTLALKQRQHALLPSALPSRQLSAFVTQLESCGYLPVWIDLGRHSTIEGIVNDILAALRRYDPGIQPLLFPAAPLAHARIPTGLSAAGGTDPFSRVIRRLQAALRRGSYIVAFDRVEAYATPQPLHEGSSEDLTQRRASSRDATIGVDRQRHLLAFLHDLGFRAPFQSAGHQALGQTRIAMAIDIPPAAYSQSSAKTRTTGDRVRRLLKAFVDSMNRSQKISGRYAATSVKCVDLVVPTNEKRSQRPVPISQLAAFILRPYLDDFTEFKPALLLAILSVLRCPFNVIAIRSLVADWIPPGTRSERWHQWLDSWLRDLEASQACRLMEGGQYWIPASLRVSEYNSLTGAMRLGTHGDKRGRVIDALVRALFVSAVHQRAARYYYTEAYLPSRDPNCFCEYLYHRLASLAHLKHLSQLLSTVAKGMSSAQRLSDALRDPRN